MQQFELNSPIDTSTLPQADSLVVGMSPAGIMLILQDDKLNPVSSITISYEQFQTIITRVFGSGNLQ